MFSRTGTTYTPSDDTISLASGQSYSYDIRGRLKYKNAIIEAFFGRRQQRLGSSIFPVQLNSRSSSMLDALADK